MEIKHFGVQLHFSYQNEDERPKVAIAPTLAKLKGEEDERKSITGGANDLEREADVTSKEMDADAPNPAYSSPFWLKY